MGFLPDGYEPPQSGGRYMKLKKGQNRMRVLSENVVLGFEGWTQRPGKDGKVRRVPVRKPMDTPWKDGEVEDNKTKHFWALAVWNYESKAVQVLQITQRTIQDKLKALSQDYDWGHPRNYDVVIDRKGDGMETEYEVIPKPKTPIPAMAQGAWDDIMATGAFDLSRLYNNGDPFGENMAAGVGAGYEDGDPGPTDDDIPF